MADTLRKAPVRTCLVILGDLNIGFSATDQVASDGLIGPSGWGKRTWTTLEWTHFASTQDLAVLTMHRKWGPTFWRAGHGTYIDHVLIPSSALNRVSGARHLHAQMHRLQMSPREFWMTMCRSWFDLTLELSRPRPRIESGPWTEKMMASLTVGGEARDMFATTLQQTLSGIPSSAWSEALEASSPDRAWQLLSTALSHRLHDCF
jgi:hypothetical protein